MDTKIIFARAQPRIIKILEEYKYQADISANEYTERHGTPTGQFKITIPYDGEKYITSQVVDDIEFQISDPWSQDQLDARVGYIGISNYANTDLEKLLDLGLNNNIVSIDVPVQREHILLGSENLLDDCHSCEMVQTYEPKWPESTPLQLSVNIFDEDIISELQLGEELDKLPDTLVKQVVDSVAQQVGFKRSLIFSFDLVLALPNAIGYANDKEPPTLKRMAIEWPVETSHRLVHLILKENQKDNNVPVVYDPERSVIEWGDLTFRSPQSKSEGTNLFLYRTPPMMLVVEQPGELYQQEFLNGQIEVSIPRLFSCLGIDYFGAAGHKRHIQTDAETILSAEISISLEDCFERKTFSPYQHLQFEGVILNEMRVNDIKTLLEDQGFEPASKQLKSGEQGIQHYLIAGDKTKELETLRLWMLVEGTRSRTTRRKQIPGGQTFTTEVDTGHMTIYMRGELRGNSTNLIRSMNEVQKLLKERFQHVSTID